ncbi:MAG: prolyl oligopeptidase family serine peptidase [Leptospiraceae bacterium]|nr:prolyl oligopeptidase family serine peptidase [Leptospiraceae bacterium]MDW7976622.1 prolyl oligopeptidase family serine peptidase [Leptospiraceae bacterium]
MRFKFFILLFLVATHLELQSKECYSKEVIQTFEKNINQNPIQTLKEYRVYTVDLQGVFVDVYLPSKLNETCYKILLVLPGWKFHRKRWFLETRLLDFMEKNSYMAIAPEMGVSVYESIYFPETKLKWNKKPGMVFLENDVLGFFQKHDLLKEGFLNFALGLSTGGRGVVLLASRNPGLFTAVSSLSGDFDQTITPKDNLMRLTYGEYEKFPERWKTIDNPIWIIQNRGWKTPLYLGHGKEDKVVSYLHSQHFYDFLKKHHPEIPIEFHLKAQHKHDFLYWDSELENVFLFFEKISSKKN